MEWILFLNQALVNWIGIDTYRRGGRVLLEAFGIYSLGFIPLWIEYRRETSLKWRGRNSLIPMFIDLLCCIWAGHALWNPLYVAVVECKSVWESSTLISFLRNSYAVLIILLFVMGVGQRRTKKEDLWRPVSLVREAECPQSMREERGRFVWVWMGMSLFRDRWVCYWYMCVAVMECERRGFVWGKRRVQVTPIIVADVWREWWGNLSSDRNSIPVSDCIWKTHTTNIENASASSYA